jgi:tetratricopeptide (TPR) repeat protein
VDKRASLGISALAGALLLAAVQTVTAADRAAEPEATRKTAAMSQPVFEKLQAAQSLLEKKDYAGAMAATAELRNRSDLTPYETAQVWNFAAYVNYLQEKYAAAIEAYEKVLAQPELPEALVQSTLKTQAQLYFTQENYAKALATAQRLLATVAAPGADISLLVGQAHYQLRDYGKAIPSIQQAIDLYAAQGKQPQENWLLLLRGCYHELKDFQKMVGVMKDLIRLYPKDEYLATLAAIYSELGDTRKQLALTETLFDAGKLEDRAQVENLVNLFLMHGQPYKAARLLAAELEAGTLPADEKHLVLLSQAWYQAREDAAAIEPLERAAGMSGNGELHVRLAQSFLNLSRWEEAAGAAEQALAKGGIKRPDLAQVMLGMALYNRQDLERAREAFLKAARDERSARLARQWIGFVDTEIERRRTMEQVLPDVAPRKTDRVLESIEG